MECHILTKFTSVAVVVQRSRSYKSSSLYSRVMMFDLQPVSRILVGAGRTVEGVMLEDGAEVRAEIVLSNATPKITFLDLLPQVR